MTISRNDLRQKAEKRLKPRSKRQDLKQLSKSEVEKLVYELEVHQIELEMQNEELRRAQEELLESRFKYFDLFEMAPVGYATMSPLGIIKEINLTAATMLGIERSRLIDRAFSQYVDASSRDAWLSLLQQVHGNHVKRSAELALIRNQIEDGPRFARAECMTTGENSDLIRVNLIDITASKKAEEELRRQKDQMRLLIDAMPALIAFVDKDKRYVIVNKTYERWYKIPAKDIIGKTVREVVGEKAYGVLGQYVDTVLSGREVTYETYVPYEIAGARYVRTTLAPFFCEEGVLRGYFSLIDDITQQKEDEEKLRAALNERETLLGEIHHRVKNNLAVINSLLNLQMGKTPEESAKIYIRDCQSRIRSMALIHESLYQARDFSRLHLSDYVTSLANALLSTYRVSSSRVRLDLDIEKKILLPVDCTVPCGLILNELLSNSLKHAFPPGYENGGVIAIHGRETDTGAVELKVSDNGVGIPDHIDIRKTDQLGLQLVVSLVERQLKGSLKVWKENGTVFLITFDPARFMNV